MTNSIGNSCQSVEFENSMEVLARELELAIHWQRPIVQLVAYSSVYIRDDSMSVLENFLIDLDQKIVRISVEDPVVDSLDFWQKILDDTENMVFFIDGIGELSKQRKFISVLNHHAYMFVEKQTRLVFWMTLKEASTLAYQAPAFWTKRHQLIELSSSPKPEQVLQDALESAWQGTGEYNDQYEDTEAKILLRETLLTDIPINKETSSIRANLMLTLGVLNWRKGDYEKAVEMLQNALNISSRMRDNWFEAKCFNAIALVEASLGQNEKAIDSYKQAIRLAPDQIFAWNNLGNLCLQIDRNHEAMIAFQKTLETNPFDPIAWNGMGNVYANSGYIDDAITAFDKSIELAPSLPHPWNGLGEVYANSGQLNEAVAAYQKAIELNGRSLKPWLGIARLYEHQEHYRDASKAYQQALMIDPKNAVIWNELGCIYIKSKSYKDAIDALTKAIEIDRGFGWAYSNLGWAHASNGNNKDSVSFYLKSLDLIRDDEQRSATWNRLANSYRMLGDYQNAIKAYDMADSHRYSISQVEDISSANLQDDPTSDVINTVETESVSMDERDEEKPIEDTLIESENVTLPWVFQPAEAQENDANHLFQPSSHLFGLELGSLESQSAMTTQEIGGTSMQMILPFITKERFTRPRVRSLAEPSSGSCTEESDARVWNEKGNQLLRTGDYEEAIRAYNKAIKYDRYFGWAYTNLGIAYLQMEKYAEAVLLLQKSLEILDTDKEKAVAWNELGNLYRCLNDYHNAVVSYQKADELDPEQSGMRDSVEYYHAEANAGNAQVWNELGDTFFKSGSYDKASDCYRKVTEMLPLNGWAYNNLALSLAYQSRFEEAIPVYLKCLELFKNEKEKADVWNRLGNVYRRLNDYDNAVAAYKKAYKLNNESSSLLTRTRFSLLGNCTVE